MRNPSMNDGSLLTQMVFMRNSRCSNSPRQTAGNDPEVPAFPPGREQRHPVETFSLILNSPVNQRTRILSNRFFTSRLSACNPWLFAK